MGTFNLKRGIEYNKLARAFNGVYQMLLQLIEKIDYDTDLQEEIHFLAYIVRKEILDRIDKYNWEKDTPIVIPMMSDSDITIDIAFEQTIGKLIDVSEKLEFQDDVKEIFNKGELYYDLNNKLKNYLD